MEWLGGIVLGALLGYLLEFTRPWVKSYFEKGSLSIRERRLYILVKRYKSIKYLRDNQNHLNLVAFNGLYWALMIILAFLMIIGGLVIAAFDYILLPERFTLDKWVVEKRLDFVFLGGLGIFSISLVAQILKDLGDTLRFNEFEKRTINKLKKLGGNPAELDKE